jgi:hypothetical protein
MEDRQPARLHVELVRSPDTIEARAGAVEAAGWSVSTWENATAADDDDLSRRLSRCDGLVIGEGDGEPVPPAAATTTVVALARYPRPSQGSCSGERTTGILLVLISPKEASGAQDLRDWGDFVHLRHIAEASVPDFRTITPWVNESAEPPRYCHLYEMVGDDPQAVFEQMTPLVKSRLDREGFRQWAWHPQLVIDESRTYRRRTTEPTTFDSASTKPPNREVRHER